MLPGFINSRNRVSSLMKANDRTLLKGDQIVYQSESANFVETSDIIHFQGWDNDPIIVDDYGPVTKLRCLSCCSDEIRRIENNCETDYRNDLRDCNEPSYCWEGGCLPPTLNTQQCERNAYKTWNACQGRIQGQASDRCRCNC